MSVYCVTGVHLDVHGRLVRARIHGVNPATNQMSSPPEEVEAHELANRIAIGDEVFSVFIVPGGTVLGPRFRRVVYGGGNEGAALEEETEGRRLGDLVHF